MTEEGRISLLGHNTLMSIYQTSGSAHLTENDLQVLQEYHEFVRDDSKDSKLLNEKWQVRMARKYYNKLFKEYAIVDLTRYRENKIGMRWRTEREVIDGKGQFTCASVSCNVGENLQSYEVPFKYVERGVVKSELVKVRVCDSCALQLFYKKIKDVNKSSNKRIASETENASSENLSRKSTKK
jgi:hypothetical protein